MDGRRFRQFRGGSLTIPDGCVVGLLGPNGAGKTNLILILVGLLTKSSGAVAYDGLPREQGRRYGAITEALAAVEQLPQSGDSLATLDGLLSSEQQRQLRELVPNRSEAADGRASESHLFHRFIGSMALALKSGVLNLNGDEASGYALSAPGRKHR